tara:strand:- start:988 stop:1359 length:372 start_codon:yes stop_codon:yes gene_type:complete
MITTNPYNKNLSTVFKTLRKAVDGNPNALEALALLSEHVKRKTPKSRKTRDYGIYEDHIIKQSGAFRGGHTVPRSPNIRQVIEAIGGKGRTVKILKKELGVCEADFAYYHKWGYIDITAGDAS